MSGLRARVLAAGALVAMMAAAGVPTAPAAFAVDPPTCSVRAAALELAEGSCANGSPLWSYRFTMYCTLDQTNGYPDYSITTLWRPTTETVDWSCTWGAAGYYNNNYSIEFRFNGA